MSFVREEHVKSVRKQHLCDGCGRLIDVGGPAERWTGVIDGDFGTAIYHPDCREAEIALNRLMDLNADEWTPLRDIEGEDRPWLEQEFPNVAARMFRRPVGLAPAGTRPSGPRPLAGLVRSTSDAVTPKAAGAPTPPPHPHGDPNAKG